MSDDNSISMYKNAERLKLMTKQQEVKRTNKRNFFNRSLQRQILIPFLTLIILSGIILSFTNYTLSKDSLINEKVQSIEVQMENLNDTFDTFFVNKENILHRLSTNKLFTDYHDKEYDSLIDYIKETVDADDVITNLYRVAEADGQAIIYPEADLGDSDGRTRDWYKDAVASTDEIVWSEPYIDEATDQMVVTASQAFYKSGKLVGVIGADILVDKLIEMTDKIKTSESGYTMIISQNDQFILHPNPELLQQSMENEAYYQSIKAKDQGLITFEDKDEDVFLGYQTNETSGWIIAEAAYEKDFRNIANQIILPIVITLVIIMILAVIVSFIQTKRITKPIRQLQTSMKEIEKGNLLAKTDITATNEIGELAQSFTHMINQMRQTMIQVRNVSSNVAEASHTLVASAEENTAASNEVATTMEQIATGAVEQAEMMEQNAIATEQLSQLISQIESHNKQVYDSANVMNEVSVSGAETVKVLHTQSEETGEITKDVVHAIQSLDEKSANISNIVTQIADIASQTNLLALNAAIEAARAGENGRGFAIVAEEVRRLAEQSEHALGDISHLIDEMQIETKHSVSLIERTDNVIQSQTAIVNDTGQAFTSIQETIERNNQLIRKVMDVMESVISQEDVISTNTENIAAISEETAAGTEEVAASVEQQTASMEQLNHLSGELENYAREMQDEISIFIIEESDQ